MSQIDCLGKKTITQVINVLELNFKDEKNNMCTSNMTNTAIGKENLFTQVLEVISSHELMPAILSSYTRDHHLRKQYSSSSFKDLMGENDYNQVEAFTENLRANNFFETEEGQRAVCPLLHLIAHVAKVRLVLFYPDEESESIQERRFP